MSISTTIKSIQDIMRKDVGVDGDAQRLSQLVLDAVSENL
jgi:type I restriction enzyme M protein